jgi:hypothetical protein
VTLPNSELCRKKAWVGGCILSSIWGYKLLKVISHFWCKMTMYGSTEVWARVNLKRGQMYYMRVRTCHWGKPRCLVIMLTPVSPCIPYWLALCSTVKGRMDVVLDNDCSRVILIGSLRCQWKSHDNHNEWSVHKNQWLGVQRNTKSYAVRYFLTKDSNIREQLQQERVNVLDLYFGWYLNQWYISKWIKYTCFHTSPMSYS